MKLQLLVVAFLLARVSAESAPLKRIAFGSCNNQVQSRYFLVTEENARISRSHTGKLSQTPSLIYGFGLAMWSTRINACF
jgi:hypothetical protein